MKRFFIPIFLFSLLVTACTGQSAATEDVNAVPTHNMANVFPEVEPIYEKFEQDGVTVEFTVKAEDTFLGNAEVTEGAYATVRFRITDTVTGEPLTEVRPAAWMDLLAENSTIDPQACRDKVDGYLKGQISNRPLVDLNSFFILALNSGNSVSVIDPLVQVGGVTQLYTTLLLESPGEDWVASADGNTLYVSLPEVDLVAVADLQSFRVVEKIPAGDVPVRLALQPDGQYLWVGNDGGDGGVTVIDLKTRQIASSLTLGGGHHEIAFTPDGRNALVTSEADDQLALISTSNFKMTESSDTGGLPVAVVAAPDGKRVYVANGRTGTVDVYSLPDLRLQDTIPMEPGLTSMSLSPDGGWIFVLNPNRDVVHVIDSSSGKLKHSLSVPNAPDQIAFGSEIAYLRPLNGTSLFAVTLADLKNSQPPALTEIPYAQRPPGQSSEYSIANAISTLPDEGAVLVADPADNMIYYLIEGTNSPAGSYQDQATLPRAVTFVDRSLQQEAPGIFSGKVRIPSGGDYQVAILLDNPLLVNCFKFTAKPGANETVAQAEVKIEPVDFPATAKRGEPFKLKFKVIDVALDQPVDGLQDFVASLSQVGGNWNQRYVANPVGDGVYEIQVTIPQSGMYNILLGISSRNFGLDGMAPLVLKVAD